MTSFLFFQRCFLFSVGLLVCIAFLGSVSAQDQVRPSWDSFSVDRAGVGIGYRVGVRFVWDASVYLSGGSPDPTFLVKPGTSLPTGLQLSTTGLLSGTPSAAGTFRFSLIAANVTGIAEKEVVLHIRDAFSTTATYSSGSLHQDILDAQVFLNSTDCPVAQTGAGSPGDEVLSFIPAMTQAITCYQEQYDLAVTGTLTPSVFQHFVATYADRFVPGDFTFPPGTVSFSPPVWRDTAVSYTLLTDTSVSRSLASLLSSGYPLPTFSVQSGTSLPQGLQLSTSGIISGTPLSVGFTETSVVVTNASGSATLRVSWDVQQVVIALSLGTSHPDIRQAQRYLNNTPCLVAQTGTGSPGQETSYFGSKTLQAVRCYQSLHTLPASDAISSAMLAHLFANYVPAVSNQSRSCPAKTTNTCVLSTASHGGVSGSCAAGHNGSCSYRCVDGIWGQVSNTCSFTPIETFSPQDGVCDTSSSEGCVIGTPTQHDPSYISRGERWRCRGVNYGYASEWCLRCDDGYSFDGTRCVRASGVSSGRARVSSGRCSATTISYCRLGRSIAGNTVSGTCSAGRIGTCQYTCSSTGWVSVSNSCVQLSAASVEQQQASSSQTSNASLLGWVGQTIRSGLSSFFGGNNSGLSGSGVSQSQTTQLQQNVGKSTQQDIGQSTGSGENSGSGTSQSQVTQSQVTQSQRDVERSTQQQNIGQSAGQGKYFGHAVGVGGNVSLRPCNIKRCCDPFCSDCRWCVECDELCTGCDWHKLRCRKRVQTAIAGSYLAGAGSAYIYIRHKGTTGGIQWRLQARIVASDGRAEDKFGYAVAVDEDVAIVGAPGDDSETGSAYIFMRVFRGGRVQWVQQIKLIARDRQSGDRFGSAVAIDGATAVVGAHLENPGDTPNAGSVYVFTRSGNTWSQEVKLVADDKGLSDKFGYSVTVSGNTVSVGAYHDDPGNKSHAGSVYVFTRMFTRYGKVVWTQQEKVIADDRKPNDQFGYSVATIGQNCNNRGCCIPIDGRWSTVPMPYELSCGTVVKATCTNPAPFCGGSPCVGPPPESHGKVCGGGKCDIVRGACIRPPKPPCISRAARWKSPPCQDASEIRCGAKIPNTDGVCIMGQTAGCSGIYCGGKPPIRTCAGAGTHCPNSSKTIASANQDNTFAGSAYILSNGEQAKIVAGDKDINDRFGSAVDISENALVVGARGEDPGGTENAGSIYILSGYQRFKIAAGKRQQYGYFGHAVSIYDTLMIVGAPRANLYDGSAYIFAWFNGVWRQEIHLMEGDT